MRLVLFFILLPVAAFAEPVSIRSGEHSSFTRLVLSFGTGVEWDVKATDNGFQIDLSETVEGFDTSEIFTRIPRDRIISTTQLSASSLLLEVTCNCHVDAFIWQPGQLVVDVIDGPDPNSIAQDSATPVAEATQFASPLPEDAPVRLPNLISFEGLSNSEIVIPNSLQSRPQSVGVSETETALIEGLARAASQGFLDAALDDYSTPDDGAIAETATREQSEVDPVDLPQSDRPGIGISTAMDRDLQGLGDMIGSRIEQRCLPDGLFAVDEWADDRALHEQVAALAEDLSGEFGEQPRDAQEALARVYLHFGFGVEARAVLAADASMSQSRTIMFELAGLLDGYDENFPLLTSQAECETSAALWAFVSKPASMATGLRNQILRDFFQLPQPLRGQIAPRLAQKFIEVGDPEGARQILKASVQNQTGSSHEVQATQAMISEAFGHPDEALERLETEAGDNARMTPTSLIRLIDLALEQGHVPKEENLLLAGAMQQEFRDSPIAAELARAEARGRIARGQYDLALALVAGRIEPESQVVVDHVFAHLAEHADSGSFLEYAYGDVPEFLSDVTENDIATRLIELGFPERAETFLSGPAIREAAAERRYLRAQAALATGNYIEVIDTLIGLSDDRARQLRSDAYAGLGEHRIALTEYGPNQSDQNTTLQFRAEAWERLTDDEDNALSSFADVVLSPESPSDPESLADRRALLAASEESRRAVEGLLTRFADVPTGE